VNPLECGCDAVGRNARQLTMSRTSLGSIPRSQAGRGHGPIIVLVMARVRHNGESSLIDSVISNRWEKCARKLHCQRAFKENNVNFSAGISAKDDQNSGREIIFVY